MEDRDAGRSEPARRICVECRSLLPSTAVICPADGQRTLALRPSSDPRVGRAVDDRFTILGELGSGGMGTVYRALQHSTAREVAVKLLHRSYARSPGTAERFLDEARAASRLGHPNIVSVHDFGRTREGELFLMMELLRGRSVADLLAVEGPLDLSRAVGLAVQVCNALEVAHAAGVVHRDLKPENVFVVLSAGLGEVVKVIDFGLAKVEGSSHALTPAGTVVGTPLYISPEAIRGRQADARSDLYGLGLLLYELLAGVSPIAGSTHLEMLEAHLHAPPIPIRGFRPDLPESLAALVERTLSKSPDDRPQSAAELREALIEAAEVGSAADRSRPRAPRPSATPAPLVGRARDLEAVEELLGAHRLVTIHGPGGVGKSRLAVELGLRLCGREPRARLVSCEIPDECTYETLCQALASALGVVSDLRATDPGAAIASALAARGPLLLVLDGLDSVALVARRLVPRWLGAAPELRVLVTSRQVLRAPGEAVHELLPLALPGAAPADAPSEAEELFLARARDASPGLSAEGEEAGVVADIVRRLEGMPLAIEVAAAMTRRASLAQVRDWLGSPGAGPGQGKPVSPLERTIELSFRGLDAMERRMLEQLSVFAGTFDLHALEYVVDLSELAGAPWVGHVVQRLRDKALVRAAPASPSGEPRYALYDSVRELAAHKLAARGGLAEAEARHASYYLWFGGQWAEAVRTSGDPALRARLVAEIDNLVAIHRRATETRPQTAAECERALLALLVADPVLWAQGLVGVYYEWLDRALTLARGLGLRPSVVARAAHARARMLSRYGQFAFAVGELEEALELARSVGDRWLEADCLLHLAVCWSARGEIELALRCIEGAGAPARDSAAPVLACELAKVRGVVRYMAGDYVRALEDFELAAAVARAEGFTRELVVNLHNSGDALARLGLYHRALVRLGESRGLAAEQGHDELVALNEILIGCVEAVSRDDPEGLEQVERRLEGARAAGNKWIVVQAAYYLGLAYGESEQRDRARERLAEAIAVAGEEGHQGYVADCERVLARFGLGG